MSINHSECKVRVPHLLNIVLTPTQLACVALLPAALIFQKFQLRNVSSIQKLCKSAAIQIPEKPTKIEIARRVYAVAQELLAQPVPLSCSDFRAAFKQCFGELTEDVESTNAYCNAQTAWNPKGISIQLMEACISEVNRDELRAHCSTMNMSLTKEESTNKRSMHTIFSAILEENDRILNLTAEDMRDKFVLMYGAEPPESLDKNDVALALLTFCVPEDLMIRLIVCVPGESRAKQEKAFVLAKRTLDRVKNAILVTIESETWPMPVPDFVNASCMADYHEKSTIVRARACAVCGRRRTGVGTVEYKDEEFSLLRLLECEDEWIKSRRRSSQVWP